MDRISFLGYPVDSLDIADALDWMERSIHARSPRMISVMNANKLWQISHDIQLERIVREFWILFFPNSQFIGAQKGLGLD